MPPARPPRSAHPTLARPVRIGLVLRLQPAGALRLKRCVMSTADRSRADLCLCVELINHFDNHCDIAHVGQSARDVAKATIFRTIMPAKILLRQTQYGADALAVLASRMNGLWRLRHGHRVLASHRQSARWRYVGCPPAPIRRHVNENSWCLLIMRPPNIVLPADALSFQQCRMARGKRRLHTRKEPSTDPS
jgi:hypothetical protein